MDNNDNVNVYAVEITRHNGEVLTRSTYGRGRYGTREALRDAADTLYFRSDDQGATVRVTYVRTVDASRPVTKWDLISDVERASLDAQPFMMATPGGEAPGRCEGCGVELPTEGAFARHYILPSLTYVNLGECPYKGRATN